MHGTRNVGVTHMHTYVRTYAHKKCMNIYIYSIYVCRVYNFIHLIFMNVFLLRECLAATQRPTIKCAF